MGGLNQKPSWDRPRRNAQYFPSRHQSAAPISQPEKASAPEVHIVKNRFGKIARYLSREWRVTARRLSGTPEYQLAKRRATQIKAWSQRNFPADHPLRLRLQTLLGLIWGRLRAFGHAARHFNYLTLPRRIKSLRIPRSNRSQAFIWLSSVVISTGLLVMINSTVRADELPPTDALTTYLENNKLEVGTNYVDGFRQVYYVFDDKPVYITNESYNHGGAQVSGQYIAWQTNVNGSTQIYLYDALAKQTIQLSGAGTNQNHAIDGNRVVWETWDGVAWQLMYYDGATISQITHDSQGSFRAAIKGQQIVFAHPKGDGTWQVISYTANDQTTIILKDGVDEPHAWPHFYNGEIRYTQGNDE